MFVVLYIDPGTGSMLFTVLIGVITAAVYFFREGVIKLRFLSQAELNTLLQKTKFLLQFLPRANDTGISLAQFVANLIAEVKSLFT